MEPECGRLIEFAWHDILGGVRGLRADPQKRSEHTMAVFDPWDALGRAFYRCVSGTRESPLPPNIDDGQVLTLSVPHAAVLALAGEHYELAAHVDAPLGPDEVRLVTTVKGDISFHRIVGEAMPDADVPSFRGTIGLPESKRPGAETLQAATACFRGDLRDGFVLHSVMTTKAEGDAFIAGMREVILGLDRASAAKERVEKGLWQYGASKSRSARLDAAGQSILFANVHWLELRGDLPSNDINGVQLIFGPEEDLAFARERIEMLAATARPERPN